MTNADTEHLSPKAIRWLNKELAPRGLRVCIKCQGHPQPLDAEHFYQVHNSSCFEGTCKACRKAASTQRFHANYGASADFRGKRAAQGASWRARNREYLQAYERERMATRKANALAKTLKQVRRS